MAGAKDRRLGKGFGYLISEGNLSTRILPLGGSGLLTADPRGRVEDEGVLEKLGGMGTVRAFIHSIGQGEFWWRRFTAALEICYIFLKRTPRKIPVNTARDAGGLPQCG